MGLIHAPRSPQCLGAQISYVIAEISVDLDKQAIGHAGWAIDCPHDDRSGLAQFRGFNLCFCPMCLAALRMQLGIKLPILTPQMTA